MEKIDNSYPETDNLIFSILEKHMKMFDLMNERIGILQIHLDIFEKKLAELLNEKH